MCPLRGERARGLAPSAGAGEAGFRAKPATVGGSIPLASSILYLRNSKESLSNRIGPCWGIVMRSWQGGAGVTNTSDV